MFYYISKAKTPEVDLLKKKDYEIMELSVLQGYTLT